METDPQSGRSHRPMLFPNGNPRPGASEHYQSGLDPDGNGRDPRTMSQTELRALGHGTPLLSAIKTNCLECQGGGPEAAGEVRRCTLVWCPFWPYRMATNPFRTVKLTDAEREKRRTRMQALLAARPGRSSNAD